MFTIVGGADAAEFRINAATSQLILIDGVIDGADPTDVRGIGAYDVTVRVTDARGLWLNQNFQITIGP